MKQHRVLVTGLLVAATTFGSNAVAQSADGNGSTLSRIRASLENRGLTWQASTVSDFSTLSGGASRARGVSRELATAALTLDLGKVAGLDGTRVFVQYQRMLGANGAPYAGAAQGFSNIDADRFSRFGEVWIETQFSERLRIKAGLADANKEFAFVENGADFINSSMGYSPTIFPLPTYPDPHLGLVIHAEPSSRGYVSAAVFNGGPAMGVADFRALFGIGEAGLRWKAGGGGRVGVGFWAVNGEQAVADDPSATQRVQRVATSGQYVVLDQMVWSGGQDGRSRTVGAFVQAGRADPRFYATSFHAGGGLVARGLLPRRPDDAVGAGITVVGIQAPAGDPAAQREINVGAFYRLTLTPWLALKPDLQLIRHPGGDATRRSVMVGTIRVEAGL